MSPKRAPGRFNCYAANILVLVFVLCVFFLTSAFNLTFIVLMLYPLLYLRRLVQFLLDQYFFENMKEQYEMQEKDAGRGELAKFELMEDQIKLLTVELEKKSVEVENIKQKIAMVVCHKSEFLTNMSYELMTPLIGILGFSELILGGFYGPILPKTRVVINDLYKNAKNLKLLISDILDYSNIEAKKIEIKLEEFEAKDAVGLAAGQFMEEAKGKGIIIETEFEQNLPLVWGDKKMVGKALSTLVSNAVKFSKAGKVTIRVTSRQLPVTGETGGRRIFFEVEDTGIGIPHDRLDHIFEEFEQLESPLIKEYKGVGLGLALCEKLIELHNGQIYIESELGKGSKFSFGVPARSRTAA